MKKHKLLNKTLRYYLFSGGLMVLLVIPLYCFCYTKYYIHETDEFLLEQKSSMLRESLETLVTDDVSAWNKYNREAEIMPDNGQEQEHVFLVQAFYDSHENEAVDCRVLYSKIKIEGRNYILMNRLSMLEAQKIIRSGMALHLAFFLLMLAGFAFITRRVYRKLWKPFYQTLSEIERFNIRNSNMPVLARSEIQEFCQLNRAAENLIANNLQAYKTQKEFTENASHEMQTPLAVLRSRLDMLLQQDLNEEQIKIVQSLYESVSRLTRMNKNLLLLAKIDNLQFEDAQTLDLAEILNESLSLLSEQAETGNIRIEKTIPERQTIVHANRTLVESLANNLITNAIKHNIHGGEILVELNGKQLTIANTDAGKSLNREMLFQRFVRINSSAGGSGLGLAIARQICLLYGWEISYEYLNERHLFTVVFHG